MKPISAADHAWVFHDFDLQATWSAADDTHYIANSDLLSLMLARQHSPPISVNTPRHEGTTL